MFCQLCFALHQPPEVVRQMTSRDYTLFVAYLSQEGLPSQRLEAVIASSGAYLGKTWGGKARAEDLLPGERKVTEWHEGGREMLMGYFKALSKHQRRARAENRRG